MVAYSVDQICWLLQHVPKLFGRAGFPGRWMPPSWSWDRLLAQAEATSQIPPTARVAVMMALLGIALLGMLLVVIILLGGHWVRRQGNHRRGPVVPPDLLLKKDLPPAEPNLPDSGHSSGETAITDNTRNS